MARGSQRNEIDTFIRRLFRHPITWVVFGLLMLLVVTLGVLLDDDKPSRSPCDRAADERRAWIDTPNERIEGYAPATFRMSAQGRCADDLRVREDDCSPFRLHEAYGVKPFMQVAKRLGFRTMSCGFDEYPIESIVP